MSEKVKAQRILIFNVNWLGDVLFSSAAIRNIRRNYPDSFIACVIPSRCYPILKSNPHLDEVLIFDEQDRHRGMLEKLNFVSLLKKKKFDTGVVMYVTRVYFRIPGKPNSRGTHENAYRYRIKYAKNPQNCRNSYSTLCHWRDKLLPL